jgi:hypothetical protein
MPNNQIESIIQLLKESETALLESIDTISGEQFILKPSPTEWSIAEVIEHLSITDFGIIQNIKRKSQELTDTVLETANDNFIAKVVVPRKTKVKAPDFLVPTGKFKTKEEAIAAFQKTRKVVTQFLETTDVPLEKVVWKHFVIGLINGYGWINFISRHCQRHTLQIEEIKSTFES